jgi:hypothetical protein
MNHAAKEAVDLLVASGGSCRRVIMQAPWDGGPLAGCLLPVRAAGR